jgi:LPS O-antigen subunit length determinant protein (WzzB/FepE family)
MLMPNDVTPFNNEDDGLNIWELLDVVKSGWHWLAGGAAIGLAGAVGFVLVVPAQYEATAIIQPATVGMVTTTTTTKGAEIESTAQTLERLKLPTFYTENLIKTCEIKQELGARQGLAKAMKPTLVKDNSLIQISYRAESPAIAEACVAGVVAQLAKVQAGLAEPIIKTLEEQKQLTKLQLDESERFQSQIEKRAMSMDPSDVKFSQAMLMLNAALSKREEISKLRKLYTEQSMQLAPPLTQSTQLFEPIEASDKAVFPKRSLTALGGLIGGLVLGGLALFVRRSLSRFKAL